MPPLLALFTALFLATAGGVTITIPPGIALEEREIRAALPERLSTRRYDGIEIVIYYYSLGVEKLSYGGNDEVRETAGEGKINALVKLKKKGKLGKALFISGHGTGKDAILGNFSRTLSETMAHL